MQFTTSFTRQPPVIELYSAEPDSNESVILLGELTNIDQENPVVTIFYGSTDGGLSLSNWEHNITINQGNPLPAGQFETIVSGLSPGQNISFGPMHPVQTVQTGLPVNQKSKKTSWHFGDWMRIQATGNRLGYSLNRCTDSRSGRQSIQGHWSFWKCIATGRRG